MSNDQHRETTRNLATLIGRHDALRQKCILLAARMKAVAAHDRNEAQFAALKELRTLREASAAFLEGEAETLLRAAEEIE